LNQQACATYHQLWFTPNQSEMIGQNDLSQWFWISGSKSSVKPSWQPWLG